MSLNLKWKSREAVWENEGKKPIVILTIFLFFKLSYHLYFLWVFLCFCFYHCVPNDTNTDGDSAVNENERRLLLKIRNQREVCGCEEKEKI